MTEVKDILDALGRSHTDGTVRGSHIGSVLSYLERTKQEPYKITVSKLALVCGMNIRYVRENYLDGLEAYGIISVKFIDNQKYWLWVGLKALTSRGGNNGEDKK